ncbi:hypothetical protein PspLS_09548 [Pyricularia sp. CBS 133598]|nr:hypothetical protein PspLS_09548 [Pyricularia sp. CBS 133598]
MRSFNLSSLDKGSAGAVLDKSPPGASELVPPLRPLGIESPARTCSEPGASSCLIAAVQDDSDSDSEDGGLKSSKPGLRFGSYQSDTGRLRALGRAERRRRRAGVSLVLRRLTLLLFIFLRRIASDSSVDSEASRPRSLRFRACGRSMTCTEASCSVVVGSGRFD